MDAFSPTARTQVRQKANRASYDRAEVYAILDEGLLCHVAFVRDGQPYVIPMTYGRDGDRLILHAGRRSRIAQTLAAGVPVCVTVSLLDGLIMARSATHHSMNYRSVTLFGQPRVIEGDEAKSAALHALLEHVAPGQWDLVRPPSTEELSAVTVVEIPITEAAAKARSGPPAESPRDAEANNVWSGELPLRLTALAPVGNPAYPDQSPPPPSVAGYSRAGVVKARDSAAHSSRGDADSGF